MELIFLRYATRPNPEVAAKLFEYVTPGKKPNFTTLPGVMITEFQTEENIEIVRAGLASLNIKFDLVEKQVPQGATTATTARASATPTTSATPTGNGLAALKSQLAVALAAQNFEKAAELRDQIAAIENPGGTTDAPTTERKIITSILEFKKNLKKTNN